MFWSRNTRTAYWSIPASIAATSAGLSGPRQSTPATSPTNTGCSGRIETGMAVFPSITARRKSYKNFSSVMRLTQLSPDARHFSARSARAETVGLEDNHGQTRILVVGRGAGGNRPARARRTLAVGAARKAPEIASAADVSAEAGVRSARAAFFPWGVRSKPLDKNGSARPTVRSSGPYTD